MIDKQLKVALIRAEKTVQQLAQELGCAPTSLSAWLHLTRPAPDGLADRIETALGLRAGSLKLKRRP